MDAAITAQDGVSGMGVAPHLDGGFGGALDQQIAIELVVRSPKNVCARPLPRWVTWRETPPKTVRARRAMSRWRHPSAESQNWCTATVIRNP
jgi:hypothetical protein